jgi:AcrR family transcriptional regulator
MLPAMAARPRAARSAKSRPLRGTPDQTRARLVAAAAEIFNRDGFHGTDSNRIAREAGYAPGTFYKHFPDKRAVLLEAWRAWVGAEWDAVRDAFARGGARRVLAERLVEITLEHHRRWRGFRATVHALIATDTEVRRVHRAERRRQLELMRELRLASGREPHAPEDDALLLFTLERACDAIARGEARALGLSEDALRERLVAAVERNLA